MAANLSKSTVSLVLNGKNGRIPKETQELVRKTATELGYRPNKIAKSLSQQKTKTIGLIIPDIRNAFFSDIAKGVEDEAYSLGFNVFFCTSDNDRKRQARHIKALTDWGVDGIVFDMAADNADKGISGFRLLEDVDVPVVLVDRNICVDRYSSVMLDNERGAYDAAAYLIKLGHKRIGCIAGAMWLDCDKERLKGFKKALHDADIAFDEDLLLEAGYQFESGGQAGLCLLKKGVSAVFAFNDLMAYGAVNAFEKKGLNVPGDISVIGFDDIYFSRLWGGRLTTVVQPSYEMGKKALTVLVETIENTKTLCKHYVFQPELMIRDTTAAV